MLDTFGPGRCMFGSDFPMDAVSTKLPALVQVMARTLSSRTAAERDGVFCDNARRFYGVPSKAASEVRASVGV